MEQLHSVLAGMESITEETVLQALFNYYLENTNGDRGSIARGFEELDILLCNPDPKNYEKTWRTAVQLSSDHEERGFQAGFRMGLELGRELGAAES